MSEQSTQLSIERLNHAEGSVALTYTLNDLEHHLACDRELHGKNKRLLLQGINACLCQKIIAVAWLHGWTVAVLREDLNRDHHTAFFKDLGPFLLVSSQKSPSPSVRLEPYELNASTPTYEWREDECAAILFTSGSTGIPKGVCHSRGNMLRSAELFVKHFNLTSEDHLYCLAPVHTASGFRSLLMSSFFGTRITMHQRQKDSFLNIIKAIADTRPTKIICGPVFVHQLAAYGRRLKDYLVTVDNLLCTGATLSQQSREEVENNLNLRVLNYYGQTESAGIELADKPDVQSRTNLPPPCDSVQVSLLPDENISEAFRMQISAETLYLGYLNEKLYRRTKLDTGDLVSLTPEGELNFLGRADNVLKAPSTEWLFPELLERWLKKQPFVKDALVKGVPLPGGYGCEVWVDPLAHYNQKQIDDAIVERFGFEYKPVTWNDCKITRTELGKLDQVIKKEHTR